MYNMIGIYRWSSCNFKDRIYKPRKLKEIILLFLVEVSEINITNRNKNLTLLLFKR